MEDTPNIETAIANAIEPSGNETEAKTETKAEVKTFSQDDVNKIIASEKAKYNDDKKKLLDELNIDDPESFKAKYEQLSKDVNDYKIQNTKLNAIVKNGLPSEYADFITGADEKEISAKAEKLAELLKTQGVKVEGAVKPSTEKTIKPNKDFTDLVLKELERGRK